MTSVLIADNTGNINDAKYGEYLARVSSRFANNTTDNPVFTTGANGLFDAFIQALPADERPFHQCRACRTFLERYGALVTIDDDGKTVPAVWNIADAYDLYVAPTEAILKIVGKAKVTGVFLASEKWLGTPKTGDWCHLAVKQNVIYRQSLKTASQSMAEKKEDYKNVSAALADFTAPVLEQAIRLLESDALYRSEKVLGAAVWLRDIHAAKKSNRGATASNLVWKAIATAPAGFCHPRSSMIGTLLDDIAAGKDFAEVSRSFAAKMHPLQHLRPQAAPKAGNIAQAEKAVEALGVAGSLARRYMRPDEIKSLWTPAEVKEEPFDGGVFGHLKAKGAADIKAMELPAVTMTWEKFQRTVLPTAQKIELKTNSSDSYTTFVTAVNPDAPSIVQWDHEDERNPASWYLWHNGSSSAQYGLPTGAYVEVIAVTLKPCHWGAKPITNHGEGVVFALKGAKETRMSGAAIFPEILKPDFHAIRQTIEAYSRSATIADVDGNHVVGPLLDKGGRWAVQIRVTSKGQRSAYVLDRWD